MSRISEEEERRQFIEGLDLPLEGESAQEVRVPQETIERENDGFDALMGMTGGRTGVT